MIAQLLKDGKQTLSFEVFPPKKEEEFENAQAVLNSLAAVSYTHLDGYKRQG